MLNERAAELLRPLPPGVAARDVAGCRVLDFGVEAPGGLDAGVLLARVCLAGLADVSLHPPAGDLPFPAVRVQSDDPVRACLASQYAGWQVAVGKYFAMGSGPMRAAYGKEAVYDAVGHRERPAVAVGVLETRKFPPPEVVAFLAERLQLPAEKLTLCVAPTTSLAGSVQVVARSLETALHKLHELHFDLSRVVAGVGTAPLLPPAADDLGAIGRTNDAILYGGRVVLYVRGDDDAVAAVGPKVPASASPDFGAPFAEVFRKYGDFYKIDPLLFSPAEVTFCNLATGRSQTFGGVEAGVLRRSVGW